MQRVHRDIDAILNEIIEEHQAKGFKETVRAKTSSMNRHLIRYSGMGDDRARPETHVMQKAQAEVRKALKGKTKVEEKEFNKLISTTSSQRR
ncbi:hypothetical protein HPP92_013570 [Vanilla planifolia]|uniref:Uncharacterized protein n=1 Tax=Vanilla planifolia TaxID=51239 RepID=A0A835QV57_VANPL|nr:hypothetical protein HPP92_013570 [Vanilla planifolia]